MGQRFYIDESDLDGQLTKLDENLWGMLDFAYIHEDVVNTIDVLMGNWFKEDHYGIYKSLIEEYENFDDEGKGYYEDINEWLMESGRWWFEEFTKLDDNNKKLFIERYRLTISTCLFSNTYDEDELRSTIEESWEHIVGE